MAEIIEHECKAIETTSVISKKGSKCAYCSDMGTDRCVTCDAEQIIGIWDV